MYQPFPSTEWCYLLSRIGSDLNVLYEALEHLDAVGLLPPRLTLLYHSLAELVISEGREIAGEL